MLSYFHVCTQNHTRNSRLTLLQQYLHSPSYCCCRIDGEMTRLDHIDESEAERIMKKQRWSRMEPTLPTNFDFEADGSSMSSATAAAGPVAGFTSGVNRSISSPRRRKDEKMAENDPMRYCADRCVTTGNCDVFEVCLRMNHLLWLQLYIYVQFSHRLFYYSHTKFQDMFEMGPSEVIKFCNECVLSEEDEPCDIPESFFGSDDASLSSGLHP
mmetsp:Transcript_19562/g.34357  ORF Transcript_19562/g.34357 Transcript_19562/m.34357 type:complete len:213 (+) Transcript_19562:300-938(+)